MAFEEKEDFGIPKSTFTEFLEDLQARLTFLSGKVDYEKYGFTLEDIRKPILCLGKPGIGKTCGIVSKINEINATLPKEKHFNFKKILLGQTVVGSLSGVPVVNNTTGEIKRAQAPELPVVERDGEYGVLFLDEITTADEAQVQPALGLCDDTRNIGEYTLPEHWLVIAAGNGVDCSNFLRLDDMTLSRFSPYDIEYKYEKDWRPYAHAHGIDPMIIAFLNFKPDRCVSTQSEEYDKAGKMFPCPRTWERLSIELRMREAVGRPVPVAELDKFAGRIIGKRVGREFASFYAFKDKVAYDVDKILKGEERDPEPMETEVYHILSQACVTRMKTLLKETVINGVDYPPSTYETMGHLVRWFLKMKTFSLEVVINFITEMSKSLPDFASIMLDPAFDQFCPEFDKFVSEEYTDVLKEVSYRDLGY